MKFPTVQSGQTVEVGGKKYAFSPPSTISFNDLVRQLKEAERVVDDVKMIEVRSRIVNIRVFDHTGYEDVVFSDLLKALGAG